MLKLGDNFFINGEKKLAFIFVLYFSTLLIFAQNKQDALLLYRQGKFKQAISVCESEIKNNPNNLDSYVVITWALLADKQYERAYQLSLTGRKISQNDPRLIATQAESCFYLGKNEESLKLFQDYISYAPNGVKIPYSYYFMGEIYLRISKYEHADIALSVAVKLENYNSFWWVRLGYAREQTKDYRYSLEAYDKALKLNKNLIDAQKGKERVLKYF